MEETYGYSVFKNQEQGFHPLGSRGTGFIPSGWQQHRLTRQAWAQVARKVPPRRWHFAGLGRISQILPGREKRKHKIKRSKLIGTLGQQIKDRNLKSESKSYHHLLYPYTSHLWHLFEGKKREREVISNTKHL